MSKDDESSPKETNESQPFKVIPQEATLALYDWAMANQNGFYILGYPDSYYVIVLGPKDEDPRNVAIILAHRLLSFAIMGYENLANDAEVTHLHEEPKRKM